MQRVTVRLAYALHLLVGLFDALARLACVARASRLIIGLQRVTVRLAYALQKPIGLLDAQAHLVCVARANRLIGLGFMVARHRMDYLSTRFKPVISGGFAAIFVVETQDVASLLLIQGFLMRLT